MRVAVCIGGGGVTQQALQDLLRSLYGQEYSEKSHQPVRQVGATLAMDSVAVTRTPSPHSFSQMIIGLQYRVIRGARYHPHAVYVMNLYI